VLLAISFFHSRGKNPSEPVPSTPQPSATQTGPAATPVPESKVPAPEAKTPTPEASPPAKTATNSDGVVLHQVMPDLSQSAKNTIHGTIKIGVVVDVGPSGKVIAIQVCRTKQVFCRQDDGRRRAVAILSASGEWRAGGKHVAFAVSLTPRRHGSFFAASQSLVVRRFALT
jgi:hypothetical protein